jgi:hypothetical protein
MSRSIVIFFMMISEAPGSPVRAGISARFSGRDLGQESSVAEEAG